MNFQIVFSGVCAYVPNRLADDPAPAPSWSALLPEASEGLTVNDVTLTPHYSVLQFPTDLFEVDEDLITLRFRKDGGREFGLIQLSGHQIRIETGAPKPFNPVFIEIDQATLEDPSLATEQQKTSLKWLPAMEDLLPGSGVFGNNNESFFKGPLPTQGDIAAHVIIDQGDLMTYSLIPDLAATPTERPSIWGFHVSPNDPLKAKQAVAHAIALRIDPLTVPLAIHLFKDGQDPRVLRFKDDAVGEETVTIEIKNREMDEVLRFAEGKIPVGTVDIDFKALYMLSGMEQEPCPLPFMAKEGGLGCLRTTCGGGGFKGFASNLKGALAAFTAAGGGGKP